MTILTRKHDYLFLEHQTEFIHHVLSEQDRQELVVGNVLNLCDINATGFLVYGFVVPVRVDSCKTVGYTIVLTSHQNVHHCEDELLVYSDFTLKF